MVLFDLVSILFWCYVSVFILFANMFKILLCFLAYVCYRLDYIPNITEKLNQLSRVNETTEKYYLIVKDKTNLAIQTISPFINPLLKSENLSLVKNKLKQYFVYCWTLLVQYLEKTLDLLEIKLKENPKINEILEIVEKKINENRYIFDSIKNIINKIDIENTIKTIQKMNTMRIEMERINKINDEKMIESNKNVYKENDENDDNDDDDIFDNKINDNKEKDPMSNFISSIPPEILTKSMEEAKNIDLSKLDLGKMMDDMNKMFGSLNNLENINNIKSRKLRRKLNKKKSL